MKLLNLHKLRVALTRSFLVSAAGCASTPTGLPAPVPDRAARMPRGYLYYLDGAGGGTAKENWADGVKEGLLEAGYPGAGEMFKMFTWETGAGLMADQDASVAYKRSKAVDLASEIRKSAAEHPRAPISILRFSVGTAVAIFALEELPETIGNETIGVTGRIDQR